MPAPQLKANLGPDLIKYIDEAVAISVATLGRGKIYRATVTYTRGNLRPEAFAKFASEAQKQTASGVLPGASSSGPDASGRTTVPLNFRLTEEEDAYIVATIQSDTSLKRILLGEAAVRYAKTKLNPAQLAAFAAGGGGGDPPPPPPPSPIRNRRHVVVLGIAVLIVCGGATVGLPRGIAALRGLGENESKQTAALLATASDVMAFQEAKSLRWTLGIKAQEDLARLVIPGATTKLLWVTSDPEDNRILARILDARKANPRLKISIVTNDGSSAQAGILRMTHGLDCKVTTSPIGNISWIVIDDHILVEATTMFATGRTSNASAIASVNAWAALLTAQPASKE